MNRKKKTAYGIILGILILSLILQLLISGPHEVGFYILFGFVGAWILILVSKRILAPLLQKSEDYYGGNHTYES